MSTRHHPPAVVANTAGEAIRELNHLTIHPLVDGEPGWQDASDIHQVVHELETMAHRLPQLLRQLAKRLDSPPEGFAFQVDAMADASADVIVTRAHRKLLDASVHAGHLSHQLAEAAAATSHLYLVDPDTALSGG